MYDVCLRDSEGTHGQRNYGSRRRLVRIRLKWLFGGRWWVKGFECQDGEELCYINKREQGVP